MRLGIPKYCRAWAGLAAIAFFGFTIHRVAPASMQSWCFSLGAVAMAISMAFLVAGMIAERREAESQDNRDESSNQEMEPTK